jgi:uncharacterized membrane protein YqiK
MQATLGNFGFIAVVVVSLLALMVLVGLVLARLYKRASRETALVRTGAGGKRVVMDGGTLVIPMLHEIAEVNMKTLRLEVTRKGEEAMITQDRMRVDSTTEFYVSVAANADDIAQAAQTLGDRTSDVLALREMIEGKLVDGLRAVAAQMTMDDLHENRSDFVQQVKATLETDLKKNGLELESVSLTALDQTPFRDLDENNAFNAVGMQKLTETIEASKKRRAEIQAESAAAQEQSRVDGAKRVLASQQEEEAARLAQQQEIETLKAAQEAKIAEQQEQAKKQAEEARIQQERDVEVAQQERRIIVANKSRDESQAQAEADAARAEAVKAEEAVKTAAQEAEAERLKRVAVIAAQKEAEVQATGVKVQAEAEREAAENRAAAVREAAQAEADAMTVKAEATKAEMLAQAEGQAAIVAADNAKSPEIIALQTRLAEYQMMPALAAELVKPAEKIEGIRINHLSGLGGQMGGAGGSVTGGGSPDLMNAILGTAMNLPAFKEIGEQFGATLSADALKAIGAETPQAVMPALAVDAAEEGGTE